MSPGTRTYESASLRIAVPESLPEHLRGNFSELIALEVPPEDRRKGYASKLLRDVVLEADSAGRALLLWVRPYGEMGTADLIAFYRKYSFEVIQQEPAILMARRPRVMVMSPTVMRAVNEALH